MKLKNILGAVLLSGASFVAGHDFGLIYPTVPKNEAFIKEEYKRLLVEEKIEVIYDDINYPDDIDPNIRKLQHENRKLINDSWIYRFLK